MIRPILRIQEYLEHILKAIDRISAYTADIDEAAFMADQKTQDAVTRNLEIIGEAAQNLRQRYPDFVASYPELPWRSAYGMRNALTHGYFAVELDQVWTTIQNDLPSFRTRLRTVLRDLPGT
ncbi:MAG TPA: DUF86 domain-containing protein [Acetobacteraceae bacterium]|nr:DUF86 domain-containing protein [Acetobacteraceae bacterium]